MAIINVIITLGDLTAYEKEHSVNQLTETEELLLEILQQNNINFDDYEVEIDDGITIKIDRNISIYAYELYNEDN